MSQTGDQGDLAGRMTRAQALLAACDDACTDLRTGDTVFDLAGNGRLLARQSAAGCAAIFSFDVTYSTNW